MRSEDIQRWLAEQLGPRIGLDPDSIDRDRPLDEYGVSSLEAVSLTGEIEAHFGCRIEPTALWDHRTLGRLAAHVASIVGAAPALPESEEELDALLLDLVRRQGRALTLSREQLARMSVEEKRALAKELLREKAVAAGLSREAIERDLPPYTRQTYDMFLFSQSADHAAASRFDRLGRGHPADGAWGFEAARSGAQRPEVEAERDDGARLSMLNMSSYNYLGYGYHPEVVAAAKEALDRYGLGAGQLARDQRHAAAAQGARAGAGRVPRPPGARRVAVLLGLRGEHGHHLRLRAPGPPRGARPLGARLAPRGRAALQGDHLVLQAQ